MDSGSIYPLLKHNYPNYLVVKKDLYNVVYLFHLKNNLGDSDVLKMLQTLLNLKETDLRWLVKPHLEPLSRKLNRLL